MAHTINFVYGGVRHYPQEFELTLEDAIATALQFDEFANLEPIDLREVVSIITRWEGYLWPSR